MEYTSRKKVGNCEVTKKIIGGRRIFKCKNLKRPPTAEEIIKELKK